MTTNNNDGATVPTAPCPLTKIRKGTHYLWQREKETEFILWWKTIAHSKGPSPNWASKKRKIDDTTIWPHFDKCASITTSEPALCCRSCHETFVHPNVRRSGNSALSRHMHSSCASATGPKDSMHQPSLADVAVKVRQDL
jgi:hypothetical protein